MEQLFAEIRETSKYADQASWAIHRGRYPFRVRIEASPDGYVVRGGPGGCYRPSDVYLLVIYEGQKIYLDTQNKEQQS